jgi:hypothetical protein
MLSGMRNHVFELTCFRSGVIANQGRGLDDLPPSERDTAAGCIPRSLEPQELKRAFQNTMLALLREIAHVDEELQDKLSGPLREMTETSSTE